MLKFIFVIFTIFVIILLPKKFLIFLEDNNYSREQIIIFKKIYFIITKCSNLIH